MTQDGLTTDFAAEAPTENVPPRAAWRRMLKHAVYYLAVLLPPTIYLVVGHFGYDPAKEDVGISIFAIVPWAAGLTLLVSMVWLGATLCGLLWFGAPRDRAPGATLPWPDSTTLIVCYVSRGNQPAAMRRASLETQQILDDLRVRYELEFVTDIGIEPAEQIGPTSGPVTYEIVPPAYQTPAGAKYKARALQYMLERRTARLDGAEMDGNVWVLHLDEESVVTPESVLGIATFVDRYDLRKTPGAIGQGEILYNSGRYGGNAWIEAIDALRTGEDLGRFRLQMAGLHRPVFGIHGSFILVPARIERDVTWDVGGRGSVTEDAHFSLVAMERGVRFDWVEGCIREQSPFTIRDLLQQRRRWFCGLRYVATDPGFRPSTTLILKAGLLGWAFGSLGIVTGLILLAGGLTGQGTTLPYPLAMSMALLGGTFSAVYVLGALRNIRSAAIPFGRKCFIIPFTFVACLCMWPAIIESLGVLYAVLFPVKTFYVVAKDVARFESTLGRTAEA